MKLRLFLCLFLSSVTFTAARADPDTSDGRSQATFSPSSENVIDLRNELRPGQTIRFVVPNLGIVQGRLHDGVFEGTFIGVAGKSPFDLDRAPEPDFSQLVD